MVRFYMKIFLPFFCILFLNAALSSADIYKYVDDNGVICYTDSPYGKKTEKILTEKKPLVLDRDTVIQNHDYSSYVHKAAAKYAIEPELINAVIKAESNGNHKAISRKGALGLMQLMPSTAVDMNVSNPFNPEENIEGGTRYLRQLIEKFNGDLTLALAAYNAGPKTVEKYGSVPPISETKEYVKKIYSFLKGKPAAPPSIQQKQKPAPQNQIFKVVLDDGTILFTNSSFAKANRARL